MSHRVKLDLKKLPLPVQQFLVLPLVFRFRLIQQKFGKDTIIGEGKYLDPFGYIATCEGVYCVNVFKFFKRLYTCLLLQY